MIPVAKSSEVRAADERALARVSHDTLVMRAGTCVAHAAMKMIERAYGTRVVIVAGKGSNGADGRVAGRLLARRGALVEVVDASYGATELRRCDLVVDAAYGTGFRGSYVAPVIERGVLVLAVDIPSGVAADTGEVFGSPMVADKTVTFAALKRGLLMGEGRRFSGSLEVADIGVALDDASAALVEDSDVFNALALREESSHKWKSPVAVVAGSTEMRGAAELCARGAIRAGAGIVSLGVPGEVAVDGDCLTPIPPRPLEAIHMGLGQHGWAQRALEAIERCKALVIGPGIGRSEEMRAQIVEVIERARVPVVVDADALVALGDVATLSRVVNSRSEATVLTPHDGEYEALTGEPPGSDRITAACDLAHGSSAIVLLKGSLTTVASGVSGESASGDVDGGTPSKVLLVNSGSSRLATAGTGDVLSGMIGAFIARGLDPFAATAFAAHVHGRAASLGRAEGLVAGDLPELVSRWLSTRRVLGGDRDRG